MLKRIEIANYAIIDRLSIEFSHKMNIITGETGAGKSIVMGALSLILGDRADTSVLLNREQKCVVEGVFSLTGKPGLIRILQEHDLDGEEELMIRREISSAGKSRAFINDTPVNLEQLRLISSELVDLHRQFDTLELGQSSFQREVLDALAGNQSLLASYQKAYSSLQKINAELQQLQEQKQLFTKEFDYNQFLYNELEEAGFAPNELEDAEQELKMLGSSEGIKGILSKITTSISEGEQPMVQQIRSLMNQLQSFVSYHPSLQEISNRLSSMQIELQDISDEVEIINDKVNYDPARTDYLNGRISSGYKLLKKHGLKNTGELLELQSALGSKLQSVLNIDEAIEKLSTKAEGELSATKQLATKLSEKRKKEVKSFEASVNALLHQVGMPNARLKVELLDATLGYYGVDAIEFLFDANKSNRFEPIRKVASGGELSRLMLCIKSLVAQSVDLPTMIFDEIDSGISGEAAKQVGIIMKELAFSRQLIAITHQPQIAGKADAHYFVYKEIKNESIKTNIRLLSTEERITAVARMLSGEKPTAAALENAREMVMN